MDRAALTSLLTGSDLHAISRRAHAMRAERFGKTASFALIDHLDPGVAHAWCPICGEVAGAGGAGSGFGAEPGALSPHVTDLHVLPAPRATAGEILALPAEAADALARAVEPPPRSTFQIGTASALEAATPPDRLGRFLADLVDRGLRQVSDGVFPAIHAGGGPEEFRRWMRFWREAATMGLKGHAAVLYGPDHGIEGVRRQIERIATLQEETGVFLGVAPVIHATAGFGGALDNLLTHGREDLRVLAACRLGLPHVPHVRVAYNRADLKLAHVSLACGADDVDGHLDLGERDRRADADAFDLSRREIPLWLREAGFAPRLRNGLYESVTVEEDRSSAP